MRFKTTERCVEPGTRAPSSLGQSLDRKVYIRLREHQTLSNDYDIALPVSRLYGIVQEADVSLRRVKRQILEKSIEKALDTIRLEDMEDRSDASNDKDNDPVVLLDSDHENATSANRANKNITSMWNAKNTQSDTTDSRTPIQANADGQAARSLDEEKTDGRKKAKRKDAPSKEGSSQSTKRARGESRDPPQNVSLEDVGGVDECVNDILELIAMPIKHPEVYLHTGVQPPRGVLLHGPPGCGKTLLANALAGELGVPFISISAPSVVSGMSGESEKNIRDFFEEARSLAPCLMFIDEIDAVTPKRESAQREMERRIVAQFLTCIDDLSLEKTDGKPVLIIGATNRPDALDSALRRAGRFDREIGMTVPDEVARERILQVVCRNLRLSGDFDLKALAKMTPGYVGADLKALSAAAGVVAIKRIFRQMTSSEEADSMAIDRTSNETENSKISGAIRHFLQSHPDPLTPTELGPLSIIVQDFLDALPKIQPSSKREGFATVPDVTWSDIGALNSIRIEMQMAIVQPIRNPEVYEQVGITAPAGVLLWGPPGCGKTLLAKAVANESRANFISVRGPELLNKYVGESERAVRQVFNRARASAPCVIFFDELDALVPRRDESLSESSARVVNTLLTELDGLSDRKGVYVIAATNRPDIIDPAMLRPGRLDKPLFVDLPQAHERSEILKALTKKSPVSKDLNMDELGKSSELDCFSGADLAALVRETAVRALRKSIFTDESAMSVLHPEIGAGETIAFTHADFINAARSMRPSVTSTERKKYLNIARKYGLKTTEDTDIQETAE